MNALEALLLGQQEPWLAEARCRIEKHPNELFFPPRGALAAEQVDAAKAVCARCRVSAECLEYGLRMKEGVWGGTSPQDRRRIRAERARARRLAS